MSDKERHLISHSGTLAGSNSQLIAEYAELSVSSLVLEAGEKVEQTTDAETAWLLMDGRLNGRVRDHAFALQRQSLFDESASCIHAAADTLVVFEAVSKCELTVYRCRNRKPFPARVFLPEQVPDEYRGKGQVAGRCLRIVRTIFDGSTSPENAELVLGEVVTLPGGWSSYPPHHHLQPEIYHYRFTHQAGYGHAEVGESVYKVKHRDTICIPPGLDHAQCAAPGYGMYYSWVIRHLPDAPYTVPDFTAEHAWTMDKEASYWWPGDLPNE